MLLHAFTSVKHQIHQIQTLDTLHVLDYYAETILFHEFSYHPLSQMQKSSFSIVYTIIKIHLDV